MNSDDLLDSAVELVAHNIGPQASWPMRAAPLQRDWMDAFRLRWPYRCLPLNIANQSGWELLCPVSFEVIWDGGVELEALQIEFDERAEFFQPQISSHFGGGILSFLPPVLFRTQEPVGLFVRGPCNFWIDGTAALDGWVESWGLEANFTMNWQITRPGMVIRFEKGQPICLVQPFDVGLLERVRPVQKDLADDPELGARFERWKERRFQFDESRSLDQSQHTYTQGRDEAGEIVAGHRTTLDLREFSPPGAAGSGSEPA